MKNKLLITTALVAFSISGNVHAENLPIDAANLTSGTYVVEDNRQSNIHSGNVKISGDASLTVNTYADVDTEQDIVTSINHAFRIDGNLEVGDAKSGGGRLSITRDDAQKPFMIVSGNLTTNDGAGVEMSSIDYSSTLNIAQNADIKGGDIKMDKAEIFVNKDLNIAGGNIIIKNGGLFTAPTLSEDPAGDITISGGHIEITEGAIGAKNGIMSISGGTIDIKNSSDYGGVDLEMPNGISLSGSNVGLAAKKISISRGDTTLRTSVNSVDSFEMTGGSLTLNTLEKDKASTLWSYGDINLKGGTINLNSAADEDGSNITTLMYANDENYTPGNINLSGAVVNVTGEGNMLGSAGKIEITDGSLNIAENAVLDVIRAMRNDGHVDDEAVGTLLLNGGEVNLSGALVSNVSGDGFLNIKSSKGAVEGDMAGANLSFETGHSLSKAVSGTIGELAALNVNKGTLTYDKATGKIGNLNVAGALDIGTNTVEATNVDFKDNSKLALRVSGADNYGQINANTIKIGNDTTMNVTLDNGVVAKGANTKFKFLNGMVTGDFENKIAENSRYDIEWTEDGYLSVTSKASGSDVVSDIGGSAANAATAEAWDSINSSSSASEGAKAVASTLNELSQNATDAAGKQAYIDALTAVAPEIAPMVQKTQVETSNQVFGAVGTRLSGGSISTGGEGMASGDNVFERAAMWVQGLFNKSKLDDTSKAKGFDADTNGLALGFEKFVTDDVKAGVGYAYSKTDIDGFMRSTDVDTHTALLYGEYKPSNWYVNGIATYGWSDYSEKKTVAGVNVKADYDVETLGLQAMTGYEMNVSGLGVTPEAGLRYVHIKQDSYKDSADQRVSANDSDILTGVIGAKVSKDFELSNDMNIRPEARVAATYDLMNDDVNSVVTLANGSAYAVEGEALDRFGMEFGAGVTAEVNDNIEFSLGYEGKFRQDYQDHTGLLNVKYKF